MEKSKINEGNAIIAKFLGWKLITPEMRNRPETWTMGYWEREEIETWEEDGVKHSDTFMKTLCSEYKLKYHKSWDWLMPVFHKITKMIYDDSPSNISNEQLYAYKLYSMHLNNSIEAVWLSVLDYIIWYNEQQKEKE
jgi:hypothetical protein